MSLSSQTHGKAMSGCRVWRQAWIRHITPPPHTHTHTRTGSHWGDVCDSLDSMPVYISQIDRETLRGSWIKLGYSMGESEMLIWNVRLRLSLSFFLYTSSTTGSVQDKRPQWLPKKPHVSNFNTHMNIFHHIHRHSHAASIWYFPQTGNVFEWPNHLIFIV